ncbi:ABC transporter ATP-binding protein [Symbiobacterium thermophilum]|uniref:ABC transporter ATP-binding protein n=2 Tax=Symbiobacterium thermophilum TaxID=2734 RepID=Q67RS5_SYMTH|nr:ABC transporter ATP-binding protein [Symbiobacterium thermophilum]BAD39618.1 ABC transporter ATP-binding protein [Symbiobacterium thermophilum IAM 14863]
MGMGQYRTARELRRGAAPRSENADRFYYREEQVFEKPFDWNQLKRLGAFLVPYLRYVILAGIAMLGVTVTRLAVPWLMAQAIDTALESEVRFTRWTQWLEPYARTDRLFILAGAMLAVYLVNWLANYAQIRLTSWVGQRALYDLRTKIFAHVQSLSMRFFDTRPAGSILVRVTNDVNSLQDLFTNGIISALQDVLTLVGIILIMMSMHLKLSVVIFAFLPLMMVTTVRLRTRVRHGWQRVRIQRSRLTAHLAEAIQGVRVTQAFSQQEPNKDFFADMNVEVRKTWMDTIRLNAWFNPIVEIMGALGTAVVYWYGTRILQGGGITVGVLVAFVTYVGQFWEPILRLTQLYGNVLVAMASSERIFEYLDTKPTVPEKPDAQPLPPIRGEVELDNVTFAYEEGRTALRGVSLKVNPGETVALVGHTGAGKTSIINLLSRFYDVNEGAVRIDGVDVRDVTLESLRRQIAVVLQDTFIFSGTIMDNIRYGRLDATDEEVIEAAEAVRAHDFIMRLPHGYQTEVRERGSRLSMGERQLISFARALLADPRILVLDEATASIDTQTELLIQEALARLLQGRTSFVIAHRLATIRNADKIVVLDHGQIVEMGTHESLMARRGAYYNLIQAQFKFIEAS